ncbi:MAG TPA: LON peptidase substrate-binding domain-containing protein [Polyangiaceae bacterium]
MSTLEPADYRALPIFPLPNAALFPGAALPLHVFEKRYRELVRDAIAGNKALAIARLKPGFEDAYEGRPAVFEVCGAGVIEGYRELDDGRYDILVRGVSRVRIVNEHPPLQKYRLVNAAVLQDVPAAPELAAAFHERLRALWSSLGPHLPEEIRDFGTFARDAEGAGMLSDRLASSLFGDPDVTQRLLEELDPTERLRIVSDQLDEVAERLAARSKRALN